MNDSNSLLDDLLSIAATVLKTSEPATLKDRNQNDSKANDDVFLGNVAELDELIVTGNKSLFPKQSLRSGPSTSTVVHANYIDSSDDERDCNSENPQLTEFGRNVKHLLSSKDDGSSSTDTNSQSEVTWKTKKNALRLPPQKDNVQTNADVYSDPIFGMRISKPLISGALLIDKMTNRDAVPMSRIKFYVARKTFDKDWVVAGAIVHKSAVKTSSKGSQFIIWTLSDLKDDVKSVAVFLFGNAYRQLWKTSEATVVGILNPSVLDRASGSKDEASLSVNNPQKVMILGRSKDFGTCRSTKKNGEKCTGVINVSKCDFCIYHTKQEYLKCSKRSELQANFAGKGLTALRNKVLGKNEVFYGGKSFVAVNVGKKSRKLVEQDHNRLRSLIGTSRSVCDRPQKSVGKKAAARLDVPVRQREKDLERLKKLGIASELDIDGSYSKSECTTDLFRKVTTNESKSTALEIVEKLTIAKTAAVENNILNSNVNTPSTSSADDNFNSKLKNTHSEKNNNDKQCPQAPSKEVTLIESKTVALSVIAKLKKKNLASASKRTETKETLNTHSQLTSPRINRNDGTSDNNATNVPFLSNTSKSIVDLNQPISKRYADRAKRNALKYIQKNGPIKKVDPMNSKGTGKGAKRVVELLENVNEDAESTAKRRKVEENEYFSERFKKIMAANSRHSNLLAQRDNEEQEKYFDKHEMKERLEEKMMSTYKIECKAVRCLICKYTNFSASDLCKSAKHPLKVFNAFKRFFKCSKCGNRTVTLELIPMHGCKNCGEGRWERTTMMKERTMVNHSLSIRGGEEKFINSVHSDANINLLVPDD